MIEVGQVTAPYMCAGVVVRDGKVIAVAPILHYMLGWPKDRVNTYCFSKQWGLEWRKENGGQENDQAGEGSGSA